MLPWPDTRTATTTRVPGATSPTRTRNSQVPLALDEPVTFLFLSDARRLVAVTSAWAAVCTFIVTVVWSRGCLLVAWARHFSADLSAVAVTAGCGAAFAVVWLTLAGLGVRHGTDDD